MPNHINEIGRGLNEGTLESIRAFAESANIDISKPQDKTLKKIGGCVRKRKKKKKGSGRHGVNPLNPNGYNYGYIHICRG